MDGKIAMRRVISREALDALLPALRQLPPLSDIPENSRLAGEYYRSILSEHRCDRLLQLCKTFHQKQQALSGLRRSINSTEMRSWRTAEEMLYGEFGFALGMPPSKVKAYLQEKLGS